jgi:hypothetical protein
VVSLSCRRSGAPCAPTVGISVCVLRGCVRSNRPPDRAESADAIGPRALAVVEPLRVRVLRRSIRAATDRQEHGPRTRTRAKNEQAD